MVTSEHKNIFFLHLDKAADAEFYSNCRLQVAFL